MPRTSQSRHSAAVHLDFHRIPDFLVATHSDALPNRCGRIGRYAEPGGRDTRSGDEEQEVGEALMMRSLPT